MKKNISIIIALTVLYIIFSIECFAATDDRVRQLFNQAEQVFLSKDIKGLQGYLSNDLVYTATVTLDGEVFKLESDRKKYLENATILFQKEPNIDYYEIDIIEVITENSIVKVVTKTKSSYELDGITNSCVAESINEIDDVNGKLLISKIHTVAKCNNSKSKK